MLATNEEIKILLFSINSDAPLSELLKFHDYLYLLNTEVYDEIHQKLWMVLANHENINYRIWQTALHLYPNDVWDNPILDFIVMESGVNIFEDLFPLKSQFSQESINKSSILQRAFAVEFPAIELRNHLEKGRKEKEELEYVVSKNINNVKVGDLIAYTIPNTSIEEIRILTKMYSFLYADGSRNALADVFSFDGCSRTSRPLSELKTVDISYIKNKFGITETGDLSSEIWRLRQEHNLARREAEALLEFIRNN